MIHLESYRKMAHSLSEANLRNGKPSVLDLISAIHDLCNRVEKAEECLRRISVILIQAKGGSKW